MYKQITHVEFDLLKAQQEIAVVDVRDEASFEEAHIPGAIHLTMDALQNFTESADKSIPAVVYCYHGVTSQSVAQLLVEAGFECVYSLVGGFECWQNDRASSQE